MKIKKKELRINVDELTKSKYRHLSKFCEKGNEEIGVMDINYNPETQLTNLWVNLSKGYGNCWMPLDGGLPEQELEKIESIKIVEYHREYKIILFFRANHSETKNRTFSSRAVSVAPVKSSMELRYSELPEEIKKIKGKISHSKVYKIMGGRYADCYAVKTRGYWSPPLFRASFECGIYDEEGRLVCA